MTEKINCVIRLLIFLELTDEINTYQRPRFNAKNRGFQNLDNSLNFCALSSAIMTLNL